jgi:hypothetical protein
MFRPDLQAIFGKASMTYATYDIENSLKVVNKSARNISED